MCSCCGVETVPRVSFGLSKLCRLVLHRRQQACWSFLFSCRPPVCTHMHESGMHSSFPQAVQCRLYIVVFISCADDMPVVDTCMLSPPRAVHSVNRWLAAGVLGAGDSANHVSVQVLVRVVELVLVHMWLLHPCEAQLLHMSSCILLRHTLQLTCSPTPVDVAWPCIPKLLLCAAST